METKDPSLRSLYVQGKGEEKGTSKAHSSQRVKGSPGRYIGVEPKREGRWEKEDFRQHARFCGSPLFKWPLD